MLLKWHVYSIYISIYFIADLRSVWPKVRPLLWPQHRMQWGKHWNVFYVKIFIGSLQLFFIIMMSYSDIYLWQNTLFDKQCIWISCSVIRRHQISITAFGRYLSIGWRQSFAKDFDSVRRVDWYGTWPNWRDIHLDLDLRILIVQLMSTLLS